jgi:glycosyltransferase involved in cell wall biosynthesis
MSLHFYIESVAVSGPLLFGWGWCFSAQAEHAEVQLKINYADDSSEWLDCQCHITRVDVLEAHADYRQSVRSGFRFSTRLDREQAVKQVSLFVRLHDGSWESAALASVMAEFQAGPVKIRAQKNQNKILKFFFEPQASLQKPIVLLIDHGMGGGASIFSQSKHRQWIENKQSVLSLNFNNSRLVCDLVYTDADNSQKVQLKNLAAIMKHISKWNISEIHVNSVVSYPEIFKLLNFLVKLKLKKDIKLFYYAHDYHALCDSWSLINQYNQFCKLPVPAVCQGCIGKRIKYFPTLEATNSIVSWRKRWEKFLRTCDEIILFSKSSQDLFQQAYKKVAHDFKLRIQPHDQVFGFADTVVSVKADPFVIGVVGNISIAKGANILRDMARLILKEKLALKIVVIGNIETYEPSDVFFSTGSYTPEQLPDLLASYQVGVCFFPSVCPETFSFVTSEIISLELPLVCFGLGAQAERVGHYAKGYVVESVTPEAALKQIMHLLDSEILSFNINPEPGKNSDTFEGIES